MTGSTPKVSVIMTVYNTEKYLEEAVNSILNQSFNDFEFIIIDDGSTDGSLGLLETFTDPRIRLIKSKENLGLIAQSNMALGIAKGEFIARMDSDDISLPERLATQVKFLESNPNIGLCGTYLRYFDDARSYTKSILPVSHDAIGAFYIFGNSVVHATIMYRKSILDKHKLMYPANVRAGGDIAFLSLFYDHAQFANIPEIFFLCRIRKTSVSRTHNQVQTDTGAQVKVKFLKKLLIEGSTEEIDRYSHQHLQLLAMKINSRQDLMVLMDWINFLTSNNDKNKVFAKREFSSGVSHYLYRQLVRYEACTISNMMFLIFNNFQVVLACPRLFKIIFIGRCLINLFRHGKI